MHLHFTIYLLFKKKKVRDLNTDPVPVDAHLVDNDN